MYTDSSKIQISKRVGWDSPSDSFFPIEISEENKTATSGRYINSFHQLACVENLFYTISENKTSQQRFNAELESIRLQSSIEVLNKILDQHPCYVFDKDYDEIINKHQSLFDDPLGYLMAIKVLEIFISSNRSNEIERNSKLSYQMLKIELEGVKNENGITVSQGIQSKLYNSIKRAQKIIFPQPVLIIGGNEW